MSDTLRSASRSARALLVTVALGAISAGLYTLLFLFAPALPEMAAAARGGQWAYALVPLAIALIFSFVHGAFTGHFWDVLGLQARK